MLLARDQWAMNQDPNASWQPEAMIGHRRIRGENDLDSLEAVLLGSSPLETIEMTCARNLALLRDHHQEVCRGWPPHQAPHFHAYYQDAVAVFGIDPIELIAGSLPQKQRRLVEAWAELHQEELWQELRTSPGRTATSPD